MARPSLADSLRASLSKGTHVDTAEKIARGFQPIFEEPPSPTQSVSPVIVIDPVVSPVVVADPEPVIITDPVVEDVIIADVQEPTRVNKQSNGQTTEQTNGQTNTCTINQTNKQSSDQTINRANSQAIRETNSGAIKQSIQQYSSRSSEQPDNQSNGQTTEQYTEHSTRQPLQQTIRQSQEQAAGQSNKQSTRYAWLPLNENQGRVLLFLYEKGAGLTNMEILVAETGIAYGTARKAIDVLIQEGYVISKNRHNGHAFRGFEYSMNNHLCSLYVARIRGEQPTEQSIWQTIKQSNNQPGNQTPGQTNKQTLPSFSSSSFEEKTTTSKPAEEILNDPELRFWAGEGVTEKQVQTWMAEFQMSVEEIVMSLRYGRFDILERGDVQNSANWFYKILTRTGYYPKPSNYRSLLEIRAEALQQQQERDREARAQIEASEFETKFNSFLSNAETPLFKQLLNQVSGFAQEQYQAGETMAAKVEMRELYKIYLKRP